MQRAHLCVLLWALYACLLLFVGAAQSAESESTNCVPRDRAILRLLEKYQETQRGFGLVGNDGVVEVYASDQSGSWTILITLPTGITCVVATGEAWQIVDPDRTHLKGDPT